MELAQEALWYLLQIFFICSTREKDEHEDIKKTQRKLLIGKVYLRLITTFQFYYEIYNYFSAG